MDGKMKNQNIPLISRREKASYRILQHQNLAACWATRHYVHNVRKLAEKKSCSTGWIRTFWGHLLELHHRDSVRMLETRLLRFWYEWPRFNPQLAARRLGNMLPNALRDRQSAIRAQFDASVKERRILMMLLALTGLSGLATHLSFYVLSVIVYVIIHWLGMSYSWVRLVSIGIQSYLFLTMMCLAALLFYYIRWMFNVLKGFREYHQVVLKTKYLLEMDAR